MWPPVSTLDLSQSIGLVLLALLVGGVLWIGALLMRLLAEREDPASAHPTGPTLEAIEQHLKAIRQSQGAGLDLRRIEHLLVDIRDSNRRIHEQWLGQPSGPGPATGGANAWPLADRIIVRLASQGYERVEILTPRERWESIDSGDGEVLVEARRSGAVYKGRVQIQGGLVGEIHLKPAHTLFP